MAEYLAALGDYQINVLVEDKVMMNVFYGFLPKGIHEKKYQFICQQLLDGACGQIVPAIKNFYGDNISSKKIEKTITLFFEGFHKRDSLKIKSVISKNFTLQSAYKLNDTTSTLQSTNLNDFLYKVVNRNLNNKWEEKLLSFDINIDGISGSLELEAYGGMIEAKNISGPIVAETGRTDIVVSFSNFDKTSPSSLTSHMGNVDITLAKKVAANVNVQTYQGEIFSGLDKDFVVIDEIKKNKKGKKQKIVLGGIMQAKVNGGGQALSLTSYSGNLYIRMAK